MDRSGRFTPGDPRPRGQAAGRSVQLSPMIKSRDRSGKIAGKYRIPSTSASLETPDTGSVRLEPVVDPLHSRALRLEQHGEGSSWERPQG